MNHNECKEAIRNSFEHDNNWNTIECFNANEKTKKASENGMEWLERAMRKFEYHESDTIYAVILVSWQKFGMEFIGILSI